MMMRLNEAQELTKHVFFSIPLSRRLYHLSFQALFFLSQIVFLFFSFNFVICILAVCSQ
jgi:hypothetical protein